MPAYAATKGALETLVKHWAALLGPHRIRVNAVAPGVIETDIPNFTKTEAGRDLVNMQLLKWIGKPDDVADVITFLASDGARWVTGASITVDGGSKLLTDNARNAMNSTPRKGKEFKNRHSQDHGQPDFKFVQEENPMEKTIQQKNKDLVLEAFDTLFNKRDYATARTFWSPSYIQHSAHIEPGREGLFNLVKDTPATLKYEPGLIVAEGDFVIVHGRFSGFGLPNWIAADILRIENGILVEHWDVIQDEATEEQSKSKAPMFGSSFPIYSTPEKTIG